MDTNNITMLDAALSYAGRGWLVFPLTPNDKKPLSAVATHGVKDATKDTATIRAWWTSHPTANVGIACGVGDCGPYVVDVDAPHGGHKHDGAASLVAAGIELPKTLTATTPNGGRHFYFGLLTQPRPEDIHNCANANGLDGVDIRAAGGYIVAPPSVINGKAYQWENYETTRYLADYPTTLHLKPTPPKPKDAPPQPIATPSKITAGADVVERARAYLAKCNPAVSGAGGHDALLHAACALAVGFALDPDTSLGLLQSDYNPFCTPPWSEKELRHKIAEVRNKPIKPFGYLRDADDGHASLTPATKPIPFVPSKMNGVDDYASRYERRRTLADFPDPRPETENENALLRGGFLRKGGALLFVSVAGAGKSVAATQMTECFAVGRDWLGISPVRPLSIGVFQAEDDDDEVGDFRNNVRRGLHLDGWTANETAQAEAIPTYYDHTGLTGDSFLDFLEYVQSRARHDLIVLNPLYSFFGGDLSKNADVASFVKRLDVIAKNPSHGCGLLIIAHTNKVPSRADDRDGWLMGGAAAYSAAGGATFANWARAILLLRPRGKLVGVYDLVAAKRGGKLGWKDADDRPTNTQVVAHSDGFMYWRPVDTEELHTLETGAALTIEAKRQHATAACNINGKPFPTVEALVEAVMKGAHVGRQKAVKLVNECRNRGELVTRKGDGLHSFTIGLPDQFDTPSNDVCDVDLPFDP